MKKKTSENFRCRSTFFLTLILLFGTKLCAQITDAEYQKLWNANTGNDKASATTALNIYEKKYPNDAKVLFNKGFYQYKFESDLNEALRNFSLAIRANQNYLQAYAFRAKVFEAKKMYDRAISDITVVIEKSKVEERKTLFSERGNFYFANADYQDALKDYLNTIAINPNYASAYNDASRTYAKLGNTLEAKNILITNKNKPKGVDGIMEVYLGMYFLDNNQFTNAFEQFEMGLNKVSLENAFLDSDHFNSASVAAYKTKRFDQAKRWAEQAIKYDPENIDYLLNRANVSIDLKEWKDVIFFADKALAINDKNPTANMLMAIGLKYTGQEPKAIAYQNKAKQYEKQN